MVIFRQCTSALLILLSMLLPTATTANVTAEVDRTRITLDETFGLTLTLDGRHKGPGPDLTSLENEFQVLGNARSSSVNIINGQMQASTQWRLTLAPKRTGNVKIPGIKIGPHVSNPITLIVGKPGDLDAGGRGKDFIVEVEAGPPDPYVQAKIDYVVRFFAGAPLLKAQLSPPSADHATIHRLGDDVGYKTQRHGRQYNVTERRFAIFPEQSGDLRVEAPVFEGAVRDRGRQNLFGRDPFNGFFNSGKPVRRRGAEKTFVVRGRPASAPAGAWLPATRVTLKEEWSQPVDAATVGTPITRTITIVANGLTQAHLPTLEPPQDPSVGVYPDQIQATTHAQAGHIIGKSVQKTAIVPNRPGRIELPAIRLAWWDTSADRARVAELAAVTLIAGPAATDNGQLPALPGREQAADTANALKADTDEDSDEPGSGTEKVEAHEGIWRWVALAVTAAWVLTLVAWWRGANSSTGKSVRRAETGHLKTSLSNIRAAAKKDDATLLRTEILTWAHAVWPDRPPLSLQALAGRISDHQLRAFLLALERSLYMDDPAETPVSAMLSPPILAAFKDLKDTPRQARLSSLPPLFPERGRV